MVSMENAENVVKPPRNPTTATSLHGSPGAKSAAATPARREPRTLIPKVAHGKPSALGSIREI
jgi:hypothetical protein